MREFSDSPENMDARSRSRELQRPRDPPVSPEGSVSPRRQRRMREPNSSPGYRGTRSRSREAQRPRHSTVSLEDSDSGIRGWWGGRGGRGGRDRI